MAVRESCSGRRFTPIWFSYN